MRFFDIGPHRDTFTLMILIFGLKVGNCSHLTLVEFYNVNKSSSPLPEAKAITFCEISFTQSLYTVSYCSSYHQTAFKRSSGGNSQALGPGTLAIIKFMQGLEERRPAALMRGKKVSRKESGSTRFCPNSASHVPCPFPLACAFTPLLLDRQVRSHRLVLMVRVGLCSSITKKEQSG